MYKFYDFLSQRTGARFRLCLDHGRWWGWIFVPGEDGSWEPLRDSTAADLLAVREALLSPAGSAVVRQDGIPLGVN